ncbi:MAG: hypothetical protein DRN95_02225 [Candidatus Hydrothermarchaeota archaeon]|nr:MAG: hypothetical protein DRN95_02225 [Candidatus Hydrothermarchaeota archaeon]
MGKTVSIFRFSRETKNTRLFEEESAVNSDGIEIEKVCNSLYIQKTAFEQLGDDVDRIKVTIETDL